MSILYSIKAKNKISTNFLFKQVPLRILTILFENDVNKCYMSSIASMGNISRAGCNKAIKKLLEFNLIEYHKIKTRDSRIKFIQLTSDGSNLLLDISKIKKQIESFK